MENEHKESLSKTHSPSEENILRIVTGSISDSSMREGRLLLFRNCHIVSIGGTKEDNGHIDNSEEIQIDFSFDICIGLG